MERCGEKVCRKPDYILQGEGFLQMFADYAIHYGDVALIVTDKETVKGGYRENLVKALEEMGLRSITMIIPDNWPSIDTVKEYWCELETEHQPNLVISLGRSNVIHFAKALSIVAPYMGHVKDLFTGKGIVGTVLPHLTIPLNEFRFVESSLDISDIVSIYEDNHHKIEFSHRELVPKVVGYDPMYCQRIIKSVS